MSHKFKISLKLRFLSAFAVCFDIFFLPLIVMSVWNNVVVDIVDVRDINYIQALSVKFGYSALTNDWFSNYMLIHNNEERFDECSDMISTRFLQVVDEIKKRYQISTYV